MSKQRGFEYFAVNTANLSIEELKSKQSEWKRLLKDIDALVDVATGQQASLGDRTFDFPALIHVQRCKLRNFVSTLDGVPHEGVLQLLAFVIYVLLKKLNKESVDFAKFATEIWRRDVPCVTNWLLICRDDILDQANYMFSKLQASKKE